jgi:ATP-dependent DNA ligase
MYGSNWSQDPTRKGKIFLYDTDLNIHAPYKARYAQLKNLMQHLDPKVYELVQCYHMKHVESLWEQVNELCYEGLIFRRSGDSYHNNIGRQKVEVSDDYYIVDANEGEGRLSGTLGSLSVASSISGEEVMRVGGGYSDALRDRIWSHRVSLNGTCVEVKGKAKFPSGALRHPNFHRFRFDKGTTDLSADVQQSIELLSHR